MPKLFDLNKRRALGEISENDLAYLNSKLVRENPTDLDYYVTRDTLEALKNPEASQHLHQLLSIAIGADQSIDVGVAGVVAQGFALQGRILEKGQPVACCKIDAFDEHAIVDNWLGGTYADEDGKFTLHFNERDLSGSRPLLIVASRWEGGKYAELVQLRPREVPRGSLSLGDVDVAD